jgi:hypothetical protein
VTDTCELCGATGREINYSRALGLWACVGCQARHATDKKNAAASLEEPTPPPLSSTDTNVADTAITAVVAVPGPGPGPGVHPSLPEDRDEEPELYALLRDYQEGKIQPADVRLGKLPDGAGRLMRAAADDMRLLMGLRLSVDEDRPLPYAASFAAKRIGLGDDKRRASRVLDRLVRAGVVECVGTLPRHPGGPPNGTKLYAPPGFKQGAVGVEVADRPAIQPAVEVPAEHVVGRAVPDAGRRADAVDTAGDDTDRVAGRADGGWTGHPPDGTGGGR